MSLLRGGPLTLQPRADSGGPPHAPLPDPPPVPVRQGPPPGLAVTLIGPPARAEVVGEVDRTTREAWRAALAALASAEADVHLHLTGLSFIDVRGAWLMTDMAGTLPPGKRIFLHRPPRILRTVLTLIGSDPLPVVVESP
ncbi:STAS domain-containing protein [Planomonospora corallina]|uniref:STAS domain-containing protein n=1 Tax=Planomonospora corallina TaxID=1806052 RepID=A0ABV8ICP3_9ACTN